MFARYHKTQTMNTISNRILYEDNHLIVVNKLPSEIVQGDKTGVPVPKNLSSLRDKKVLHKDVVDREDILDYVLGILGIKKEA